MTWQGFKSFLDATKIGDISSIIGLLVSVVGFLLTLWAILQAKSAAQAAQIAAENANSAAQMFETIVDFSSSIALIEEIRRNHRRKDWDIVPEQYSSLRKALITLRSSKSVLRDDQLSLIQDSLADLYAMEEMLETAKTKGTSPNTTKISIMLAKNSDALLGMLVELKTVQRQSL